MLLLFITKLHYHSNSIVVAEVSFTAVTNSSSACWGRKEKGKEGERGKMRQGRARQKESGILKRELGQKIQKCIVWERLLAEPSMCIFYHSADTPVPLFFSKC